MNQSMRPSRVLRKLRAGQAVCSYKINFDSARAVEVAARAGFDCVWADTEHVASDWSLIEKQIWAAKSQDVDLLVRVARGSYSDYIRPLEMDATGIMVPHIMSLADAQALVRNTRFQPIGRRPLDGGNADGSYTGLGLHEYLKTANEQRFVIFQVEDPEVLDDMEAIAQLDGVDMLFFGPGDFSHAIGDPGNFTNPLLVESRKRMAELCAKYGKFAGTVSNLDNFQDLLALGYNFLNLGSDVGGMIAQTSKMVSTFAAATGGEGGASGGGGLYS